MIAKGKVSPSDLLMVLLLEKRAIGISVGDSKVVYTRKIRLIPLFLL
jgi:hypothetical protein